MKARTAAGKEEQEPAYYSDPGSGLRLGRKKEKEKVRR